MCQFNLSFYEFMEWKCRLEFFYQTGEVKLTTSTIAQTIKKFTKAKLILYQQNNHLNFLKARTIARIISIAKVIITSSLSSKFLMAASITKTAPAGNVTS